MVAAMVALTPIIIITIIKKTALVQGGGGAAAQAATVSAAVLYIPCRKSTARRACAAAVKMARLSLRRTLSQEAM